MLEGPITAEELARRIDISTRASEGLLDALTHFELLKKENHTYQMSDFAPVLSEDSPLNQLGFLMHSEDSAQAWSNLALSVKEEKEHKIQNRNRESKEAGDFLKSMDNLSTPQARFLIENYEFEGHKFLDIGAGFGTFSKAVVEKYPNAHGTLLELPAQASILKKQSSIQKLSQLQVEGIKFEEYLPTISESFDDIFLFSVIHLYDSETILELLKNAYHALKPNGRLFVTSFFLEENRTEPEFSVLFNIQMLMDTQDGHVYTYGELRGLLGEAGFSKVDFVPQIPTPSSLFVAYKAAN